MAVQTRIQVRRGTLAQWVASAQTLGNGILYQGEIGYESDTGRFKIGDGSTAWSSLAYASVLPSSFVAGSGVTLTQGTNGSTLTIGLSNPTIQVSNITDFAEGVDDRVASLLTTGSGIGINYNDSANTLQVAVTGIPSSLVTNFASSVNDLIDSAVSTSIVAGSGVDIVYNSGNNTLTVSSALTAGSGLSLSHSSGNYTISLSDPTIQLVDITDMSTNARNFIATPSSANLGTLVTDETGSGSLVFSNSPTLTTPNITFSTAATVTASVALPPVQGNAPLTADYNVITSAASNPAHVTLPAATVGRRIVVVNRGANQVTVYPATGASIDGGATNTTVILPVNGYVEFYATNATTWYSTLNGSTNISAVGGISSSVHSFLSSGSSSSLSSIIGFDKTGTGNFVLATSPTLITPTLNGAAVSGNLTVSGSGLVASNINNFDSQVRTSRLDQMSVPTASVSLNSQKITNLLDPTNDQDAANKAYVDAARSGLDVKQSVRAATTETGIPITLSGLQTVDGVSLVAGDRVLVKNQSISSGHQANGIYVVSSGSWSRATDANSDAEVTAGMFVFVTEGTVNADSGWVLTTNDTITLGTTALDFAQFSGAGSFTAGNGLTKSGNTLNVVSANNSRISVLADSIDLALLPQSNSSGSAGINFAQTVSVDSYGRVTGVTSADVRDATTSAKGVASFDSGDFSVTSGAVSIKASGVGNSQLENSAITIGSSSVSLGGTLTAVSGLTSVSSTGFTGALTGNASTATTLQTSRTINGTSFNGSADITIAFVDGGTP